MEQEWNAHGTQIRQIEADTKKSHQEVLCVTNWIEDVVMENNHIFTDKWESTQLDQSESRRTPPFDYSGTRAQESFGSPTDHPPTLPGYGSRIGGDCCTASHNCQEVREDRLLMSQLVVVTGTTLHRGGGGRGSGRFRRG